LQNNLPPMPAFVYNPPQSPLQILYQDDDLLALSKPSGLLSVPAKNKDHQDCLQTRAEAEFPEARLIHRLDLDTSGVFLMALNKPAQAHINLQFEKRKTQKYYIAHVWGHVNEDSGQVDLPICVDWDNRPRQMISHEHGRASQTEWQVIEREYLEDGTAFSRMKLKPLTGRSHQLRLHMKEIGHPILGDVFYAPLDLQEKASRLLLHAESLTIQHPGNREMITFTDPAPF